MNADSVARRLDTFVPKASRDSSQRGIVIPQHEQTEYLVLGGIMKSTAHLEFDPRKSAELVAVELLDYFEAHPEVDQIEFEQDPAKTLPIGEFKFIDVESREFSGAVIGQTRDSIRVRSGVDGKEVVLLKRSVAAFKRK
jgi:hypothetical protein